MVDIAATYPIGIDVDDGCLTAAQFKKTREGPRVQGIFCRPLATPEAGDDGDDAALTDCLKRIPSSGFFRGRRVMLNVPFRELSVFPVQFPLGSDDDPSEAILRESVKFLPYPLEEAMIDYPSYHRMPPVSYATIVAFRREAMTRWLAILKAAGLTAEVMDCGISSLVRLHESLVQGGEQADLLCHIGRWRSQLAMLTGEEILSLSEVSWGISPLREKLEAQLGLTEGGSEALNLLASYGLGYADRQGLSEKTQAGGSDKDLDMNLYRAIYQLAAPAVDDLLFECHRAISYVRSIRSNIAFGQIYLYGLAGSISHLEGYLARQLGMPVQAMDVLSHLDCTGGDERIGTARDISPVPALGLAMRRVSWL